MICTPAPDTPWKCAQQANIEEPLELRIVFKCWEYDACLSSLWKMDIDCNNDGQRTSDEEVAWREAGKGIYREWILDEEIFNENKDKIDKAFKNLMDKVPKNKGYTSYSYAGSGANRKMFNCKTSDYYEITSTPKLEPDINDVVNKLKEMIKAAGLPDDKDANGNPIETLPYKLKSCNHVTTLPDCRDDGYGNGDEVLIMQCGCDSERRCKEYVRMFGAAKGECMNGITASSVYRDTKRERTQRDVDKKLPVTLRVKYEYCN